MFESLEMLRNKAIKGKDELVFRSNKTIYDNEEVEEFIPLKKVQKPKNLKIIVEDDYAFEQK